MNILFYYFVKLLRFSGKQPLRSKLGPEYALAVLWAEAALKIAKAEDQWIVITNFLENVRVEHNKYWRKPIRGNFPNEVFRCSCVSTKELSCNQINHVFITRSSL